MNYLIAFTTTLILISTYALTAAEPLPLPTASLSAQDQMISSLFSPKPPTPSPTPPQPVRSPAMRQLIHQLAIESAQNEALRAAQETNRAVEEQTRIMRQMEFNAMLDRLYPTLPR